jgi:hypothetical protein
MTTFWTNRPLLLVLLACTIVIQSKSTANAGACTVVKDGVDITEALVVTDPEMADVLTVNCTGVGVCRLAMIEDCPRVICNGKVACFKATIHGFTHEVLCSGPHACQRTEMVAASTSTSLEINTEFQRNVVCLGTGSCDVAHIDYLDAQAMNVYCIGSKACRRANIKAGDGMVTCREGSSQYMACMGNTEITSKCLVCGERGCQPYINECSFQSSIDADAQVCEGHMGVCPTELSDSAGEPSAEESAEEVDEPGGKGVIEEEIIINNEEETETEQVQQGEP